MLTRLPGPHWSFRRLYRLSRWLEHKLTPEGRIVAGALVGASLFGVDIRNTLAYQVALLLGALFAVAIPGALRFNPRLTVTRALPDYLTAGQPARYPVTVTNGGRRHQRDLVIREVLHQPWPDRAGIARTTDPADNWFDRRLGYRRWVEAVQHARGARIEQVTIDWLPAGETRRVEIAVTPLRRGYVDFEATVVSRPEPLNLLLAHRRLKRRERLLVLPRRVPVPTLAAVGPRRFQPGGETLAGRTGDSQEFVSLRDYRPGDPLRHIHWPSWAKTGRPIVREFQDEYLDRRGLVLDNADPTSHAQFEDAVTVAASFAAARHGMDAIIDLLLVGDQPTRVSSGRGSGDARTLLEVLACIAPRAGGFDILAGLVREHQPRMNGAICVLLAWDAPRRELVRRLVSGGLAVTVYLVTDAAVTIADTAGATIHPLRTGEIEAGLLGAGPAAARPASPASGDHEKAAA